MGCNRRSTNEDIFSVGPSKRKTLNNNDHNQVFWARETEHPQLTIVLTKTAGQQPWFWSLLSKVFPSQPEIIAAILDDDGGLEPKKHDGFKQ